MSFLFKNLRLLDPRWKEARAGAAERTELLWAIANGNTKERKGNKRNKNMTHLPVVSLSLFLFLSLLSLSLSLPRDRVRSLSL